MPARGRHTQVAQRSHFSVAALGPKHKKPAGPNNRPYATRPGDKVRLERFDGDGHALFVDDPQKFNRVLEEFIQALPK
jgi:pimeloyl-ACP methyl ester carboxylesterase